MRFDRYEIRRGGAFVWTARKAAALRRKQRLEREALPLFATQVAAAQPAEDEVVAKREQAQARWAREMRDHAARSWRDARRRLRALPAGARAAAIERWNRALCPGSHEYFASHVGAAERAVSGRAA